MEIGDRVVSDGLSDPESDLKRRLVIGAVWAIESSESPTNRSHCTNHLSSGRIHSLAGGH